MEAVFLLVLPAVLWLHSWQMLGFFNSGKNVGLVAGGVSLILFSMVLLGPTAVGSATAILLLIWALYAALVAGNGLWGFDERTIGAYGAFLCVANFFLALYFFFGDITNVATVSTVMGLVSLSLSVLAALLFFNLAIPNARLKPVTGWFFLLVGAVIGVVGLCNLINLVDLAA